MESKYIQTKYFSKSRAFLYPLLKIPRAWMEPEGVFLFFNEHSIEKGELTVLYNNGDSEVFNNFETVKLLNNKYLKNCYRTDRGPVYVFNIEQFKVDIGYFLKGQYSRFSVNSKRTILRFYGSDLEPLKVRENEKMHASLFPDLYAEVLADEFGVEPDAFGLEIVPVFDKEKETLHAEISERCSTIGDGDADRIDGYIGVD